MTPIASSTTLLIIGIIAGYFGAYYRSRNDVRLLQTQIDSHFQLSIRQYELQIEAQIRADARERLVNAYEQLGIWLHNLERTIDEVWSGYYCEDEAILLATQKLLDNWYPETLRVPVQACAAQFHWSHDVRDEIRQFKGLSSDFVLHAQVAISSKMNGEMRDHIKQTGKEMRESRYELLAALDRIRDRVRLDLNTP